MTRNYLSNLSKALIDRAENECAEHDPGMVDAAAMVLVGDVYALLVCHRAAPASLQRIAERREDGRSPFIR